MINLNQPRKRTLELDLVPLINIVFLLLIFFMLTSSSISSSLKAELPEAKSSNKISDKNISLVISNSGMIELNGKPVADKELEDIVRQELAEGKTKTIEIHGDKNIEFQLFGEIIEKVRRAGAEDFIFATQKPEFS